MRDDLGFPISSSEIQHIQTHHLNALHIVPPLQNLLSLPLFFGHLELLEGIVEVGVALFEHAWSREGRNALEEQLREDPSLHPKHSIHQVIK